MDQVKIGKFIQKKRKEINLTQSELAEKLGITDRAISKWENGICLPDASTMPELCKILNISINDLLSGKIVDVKDKEKKLEENIINLTKIKEEKDRQLLKLEIAIGYITITTFLVLIIITSLIEMPIILKIVLIMQGLITLIIGVYYSIFIEQKAGYYECSKCHHKYIPTYKSVLFSQHINRTRKMKCPKCGKKSWQKKVIK